MTDKEYILHHLAVCAQILKPAYDCSSCPRTQVSSLHHKSTDLPYHKCHSISCLYTMNKFVAKVVTKAVFIWSTSDFAVIDCKCSPPSVSKGSCVPETSLHIACKQILPSSSSERPDTNPSSSRSHFKSNLESVILCQLPK